MPNRDATGPTRNGTIDTIRISPSDSRQSNRPVGRRSVHATATGAATATLKRRATSDVRERAWASVKSDPAHRVAPQTGWTCRATVMTRKKIVATSAAAPRLFLCAMMPRHPTGIPSPTGVGNSRPTTMLATIRRTNVQCNPCISRGVDRQIR